MNPSSRSDQLFGLTKTRIEALSDNIFSIAMTLLILELKVPETPVSTADAELPRRLFELWPKLQSYFISFASLGFFWLNHHFQFHFIRRTNVGILLLNFLFLLHIAFLPFSTALLGDYPHSRVGVIAYGGNLTVLSLLMFLHWRYITGNPGLVDADLDALRIRSVSRRSLAVVCFFALAIGVAFVSVEVSTLIYVIGVLSLLLTVGVHQKDGRRIS
jgi:uncharacterized membrane protein